jgi:hypothetical protein
MGLTLQTQKPANIDKYRNKFDSLFFFFCSSHLNNVKIP